MSHKPPESSGISEEGVTVTYDPTRKILFDFYIPTDGATTLSPEADRPSESLRLSDKQIAGIADHHSRLRELAINEPTLRYEVREQMALHRATTLSPEARSRIQELDDPKNAYAFVTPEKIEASRQRYINAAQEGRFKGLINEDGSIDTDYLEALANEGFYGVGVMPAIMKVIQEDMAKRLSEV